MEQVPLIHVLILSSALFFLGVYGFFTRRNMTLDTFLLLRYEWILGLLIFFLLVAKLRDWDSKPRQFLVIINSLLVLNFIVGFIPLDKGTAFFDFFRTTHLIDFEKNILNMGVLLISVGSSRWIADQKHRGEFYILMLSSLMGMDVMLSAGHMKHFPSLKNSQVVISCSAEANTLSYTDTSGNTYTLLTKPSTNSPITVNSVFSGKYLFNNVLEFTNLQQTDDTLYVAKGYWIVKHTFNLGQNTQNWIVDTLAIK